MISSTSSGKPNYEEKTCDDAPQDNSVAVSRVENFSKEDEKGSTSNHQLHFEMSHDLISAPYQTMVAASAEETVLTKHSLNSSGNTGDNQRHQNVHGVSEIEIDKYQYSTLHEQQSSFLCKSKAGDNSTRGITAILASNSTPAITIPIQPHQFISPHPTQFLMHPQILYQQQHYHQHAGQFYTNSRLTNTASPLPPLFVPHSQHPQPHAMFQYIAKPPASQIQATEYIPPQQLPSVVHSRIFNHDENLDANNTREDDAVEYYKNRGGTNGSNQLSLSRSLESLAEAAAAVEECENRRDDQSQFANSTNRACHNEREEKITDRNEQINNAVDAVDLNHEIQKNASRDRGDEKIVGSSEKVECTDKGISSSRDINRSNSFGNVILGDGGMVRGMSVVMEMGGFGLGDLPGMQNSQGSISNSPNSSAVWGGVDSFHYSGSQNGSNQSLNTTLGAPLPKSEYSSNVNDSHSNGSRNNIAPVFINHGIQTLNMPHIAPAEGISSLSASSSVTNLVTPVPQGPPPHLIQPYYFIPAAPATRAPDGSFIHAAATSFQPHPIYSGIIPQIINSSGTAATIGSFGDMTQTIVQQHQKHQIQDQTQIQPLMQQQFSVNPIDSYAIYPNIHLQQSHQQQNRQGYFQWNPTGGYYLAAAMHPQMPTQIFQQHHPQQSQSMEQMEHGSTNNETQPTNGKRGGKRCLMKGSHSLNVSPRRKRAESSIENYPNSGDNEDSEVVSVNPVSNNKGGIKYIEDNGVMNEQKQQQKTEEKQESCGNWGGFYNTTENYTNEEEHNRKNSVPRRYLCSLCSKRFTRPSTLRTHMNSHTGERPFVCTAPGCGWKFTVLSNLKRHLKICPSVQQLYQHEGNEGEVEVEIHGQQCEAGEVAVSAKEETLEK